MKIPVHEPDERRRTQEYWGARHSCRFTVRIHWERCKLESVWFFHIEAA